MGVAQKRANIVPIIEDARHPHKYRMVVSMVDTIFADVAQPDQARIVLLNAQHFLKIGGHVVISIKVFIGVNTEMSKEGGLDRNPPVGLTEDPAP